MSERVRMAPSILSADFTRLGEAVRMAEAAGADVVHVDVMDGHFVPNLTIGPPVVRALKRITALPLDVHLMIDNADDTVTWYLDAGADMVSVHVEACRDLAAVLRSIRAAGAKAGVALNPATPVSSLASVIGDVDYVLVMSVVPGFGGQAFMPVALDKIAEIAAMLRSAGSSAEIEVDGGIDETTAPLVCAAGARLLVAGNAVFGRPDPAAALAAIRAAGASGTDL
ncbi:MAG TPA: ribulose-phosphate 3-epimerase [Coriobacteriia bacterium]